MRFHLKSGCLISQGKSETLAMWCSHPHLATIGWHWVLAATWGQGKCSPVCQSPSLPITSLSMPSCPFNTALSHLYLPGNKDDVNHGLYFPCIFVKYVLFCVHVILVYINGFMLYISFSSFVPTLSTRSFTSISLSQWLCGTPCCMSSTSHLSIPPDGP